VVPGVAWSKAVAEWVMRWSRRGVRSLFGARSPIVEEAGFKIPTYGVLWLLPATLAAVFALSFLLTATASYDSENYRYLLSAELQSVAAIFAIVLTGTFVAAQVVVSATPIMMSYLPMRAFMAAVVFNVVTMAVDAVALAQLPEAATGIAEFGINLAVVLPGEALLFTFGYVGTALLWTRPDIHLAAVLNRIDEADDVASHRKAMQALEELGLHAGERRCVQRCQQVISSVQVAADVLLHKPDPSTDEAIAERERSFRLLPETLGNLGQAWARDGLDQPVSTIASALGTIALEYSKHDERLVGAAFRTAMTDIVRSCVRHSREAALCDFLANKRAALDQLVGASAQRAVRTWVAAVRDEIPLCAESRSDAAGWVVDQLEVLLEAVAAPHIDASIVRDLLDSAQSWFESGGVLRHMALSGDQTLGQAIQGARERLDQLKEESG